MAKILLVDDSETLLKMIKRYFDDEGHSVTTASDGQIALNTFQQENGIFDIIYTDINMPNMNGLELVQNIRTGDVNQKIPIVVLSTEESETIKQKGKEVGVSAWVVKPPSKIKLLKALDHFLGKKSA
jgi:two-component system chemotaxis response regulator CheY